jgi:tRNA modification GTPase
VNVGGILLQLVDTAGLRESEDLVEKIGIERSWRAMEKADLILLMVQAGSQLSAYEEMVLKQYPERVVVLVNKVDLYADSALQDGYSSSVHGDSGVWIPFSVNDRIGFDALEQEIKKRVYLGEEQKAQEPLLSNIRQISSLERALESLKSAQAAVLSGMPWDIVSIDIRQALQEISQITGDDIQESLLDDIFSRFCIGK